MLKILELFGGIGACSKALERLGIDYETADYVEIDKYAVKSFNAIHNTNFEPQDICKWNKDIEVDLIMHGSPCQDFSLAGKQAGKEPNQEWKRKLLICQHSPLRRGIISWKWDEIPYAISTHFARHHEGCEKFISTSRADRTGVKREERSQMDNVMMEMDANIQALLNISERRLCTCADPLTRACWQELLKEIKEYDEDIYWACVPQCVRCGGCVEPFSKCKYYDDLMKDISKEEQQDVIKRYNIYNEKR